jgi:hypothetical protein
MTALQLSALDKASWTAEAFFVTSLVFSIISVFIASKQQKTTGRLLQPDRLRKFIRVRKDVVVGFTFGETKKSNGSWRNYLVSEDSNDPENDGNSLCVYLPSPVSCLMLFCTVAFACGGCGSLHSRSWKLPGVFDHHGRPRCSAYTEQRHIHRILRDCFLQLLPIRAVITSSMEPESL